MWDVVTANVIIDGPKFVFRKFHCLYFLLADKVFSHLFWLLEKSCFSFSFAIVAKLKLWEQEMDWIYRGNNTCRYRESLERFIMWHKYGRHERLYIFHDQPSVPLALLHTLFVMRTVVVKSRAKYFSGIIASSRLKMCGWVQVRIF